MVLMSMLAIFCVVGTKSTMRKIVPPLGGTSPTLVLARSAVQEKSGGLLSVTHISLAGFGERKVVNWTWPSNMATALPEESILVTTRRTSIDSSGKRSEEHTSELQSLRQLVCRLLLEKKN